jgi:hypothetical protein
MGKKFIAFIAFISLFLIIFTSQVTVFAAASEARVTVQFNNGNNLTVSNTIYANFKVQNESSSAIKLSDLKLRYYYTVDTDKTQNFWCDYSEIIDGSSHRNITEKVTGKFVRLAGPVTNADSYLEVGFSSGSDIIPAGGSIEVQTRIAKSDWSNYDQSNDYSYSSRVSYADWDKVTAYINSELVFGNVTDYSTPTITPADVTFYESNPADIKVNIKSGGYVFRGITGLVPGRDYTVTGDAITISKGYLLAHDMYSPCKLTFDFGLSSNPTLNVNFVYYCPCSMNVNIGTATGNKGDSVILPITLKWVAASGNVGVCSLEINFDDNLLELMSVSPGAIVINPGQNFAFSSKAGTIMIVFLDNTLGSELITKDGVFAELKFKILGDGGKTVPVAFKSQPVFGDSNFSKIAYFMYNNGSITIKDGN